MRRFRQWGWVAFPLAGMCGGCLLVSDVLNPTFAAGLGIPTSREGAVVVVWSNQTQFPAQFSVLWTTGSTTDSLRNQVSTIVPPGQSQNAVIQCPVGFLRPAGLAGVGQPIGDLNSAAVVVSGATADGDAAAGADVVYTGTTLATGQDFFCGDVIEVRLVQTSAPPSDGGGGGDGDGDGGGEVDVNFGIQVRIVPGR